MATAKSKSSAPPKTAGKFRIKAKAGSRAKKRAAARKSQAPKKAGVRAVRTKAAGQAAVLISPPVHAAPERPLTSPIQFFPAPGGEGYHLPLGYGEDRLTLLVRDPDWGYAYWEIPELSWREVTAGRDLNGAKLILRLYDVTDIIFNGHNSFRLSDVDVDGLIKGWYFRIPEPDRSYCAELGLKLKDGLFLVFSRSNTIRAPRAGVSLVVDEQWMVADEEWLKIFGLSGGQSGGLRGSDGWFRYLGLMDKGSSSGLPGGPRAKK